MITIVGRIVLIQANWKQDSHTCRVQKNTFQFLYLPIPYFYPKIISNLVNKNTNITEAHVNGLYVSYIINIHMHMIYVYQYLRLLTVVFFRKNIGAAAIIYWGELLSLSNSISSFCSKINPIPIHNPIIKT